MLTKKQLILVILKHLLKGVAAVIIALVVISLLNKQISKIENSLNEKKRISFILGRKNETIAKLQTDLKMIGESDKKIEEAFLPATNILSFIDDLEGLANKNSLKQTYRFGKPKISLTEVESGLTILVIDYDVTISGNVSSLITYLKNFETLPYFSGISSIKIGSQDPKGWESNSTVSMKANLYVK